MKGRPWTKSAAKTQKGEKSIFCRGA